MMIFASALPGYTVAWQFFHFLNYIGNGFSEIHTTNIIEVCNRYVECSLNSSTDLLLLFIYMHDIYNK